MILLVAVPAREKHDWQLEATEKGVSATKPQKCIILTKKTMKETFGSIWIQITIH